MQVNPLISQEFDYPGDITDVIPVPVSPSYPTYSWGSYVSKNKKKAVIYLFVFNIFRIMYKIITNKVQLVYSYK